MKKRILAFILSITMIITMSAVSLSAVAQTTSPTITLESIETENGEEVAIRVMIENNPGIWGMDLKISYDKNALTLTSVNNGDFYQDSEWTEGNLSSDVYILSYEASGFDNITAESGTLATLNFKVSENASAGDYAVTASYNAGDIINVSFDDIDFNIINGKITVKAKPVSATGVSLNKETLSLDTGKSETLIATVSPDNATNKTVIWESSDANVATVDNNGKVTAVKKGTATITVTAEDGDFTDTCVVSVACSHNVTTTYSAKPSTCTEHGHEAYTVCNDCGIVVNGSNTELPYAEHTYINNADTKYLKSDATCTDKAVYYKSCSVCGEASNETFEYGDLNYDNHIGDTYVVNQKNASCSEIGYTGDVYCKSCNRLIVNGTTIPKNDHTPSSEWIQTKEPTCISEGEEVQKCVDCGEIIAKRIIPATGHNFGDWQETKSATCTEEGLEKRVCKCGEEETRVIPKTDHKAGSWEQTIGATCTDSGEKIKRCSVCNEIIEVQIIPPKGHTSGEFIVTKEASCTEAGEQKSTCSVCGEEIIEVIPALGHDFGEWTVVKEATDTEEGEKERVCSVCGEQETEIIPILESQTDLVSNEETTTGNNLENKDKDISDTKDTPNKNTSKTSPETGFDANLFVVIGMTVSLSIAFAVTAIIICRKRKTAK